MIKRKRVRSAAAISATITTCACRAEALVAMRYWLYAHRRGRGIRGATKALKLAALAYEERQP